MHAVATHVRRVHWRNQYVQESNSQSIIPFNLYRIDWKQFSLMEKANDTEVVSTCLLSRQLCLSEITLVDQRQHISEAIYCIIVGMV